MLVHRVTQLFHHSYLQHGGFNSTIHREKAKLGRNLTGSSGYKDSSFGISTHWHLDSFRLRCSSLSVLQQLTVLPSVHSFTPSSPFATTDGEGVSHILRDLHLGLSSGIYGTFQSSLPGQPTRICPRCMVRPDLPLVSLSFSEPGFIRRCRIPSSFRRNSRGPVLLDSHQGPTGKARRGVLRSTSISDLRDVRSLGHLSFGYQRPRFLRMGIDWTVATSRKGKSWHDSRKLLDRSLRSGALALHLRMIEEKTHLFLGQLLSTPKDFRDHINMFVSRLNFPRQLLTCLQLSRKALLELERLWIRLAHQKYENDCIR